VPSAAPRRRRLVVACATTAAVLALGLLASVHAHRSTQQQRWASLHTQLLVGYPDFGGLLHRAAALTMTEQVCGHLAHRSGAAEALRDVQEAFERSTGTSIDDYGGRRYAIAAMAAHAGCPDRLPALDAVASSAPILLDDESAKACGALERAEGDATDSAGRRALVAAMRAHSDLSGTGAVGEAVAAMAQQAGSGSEKGWDDAVAAARRICRRGGIDPTVHVAGDDAPLR
jgi:hypothetical protein